MDDCSGQEWEQTNDLDQLFEMVYDDIRHLALRRMAVSSHHETLQPTALVHEAFLRLNRGKPQDWVNRKYFFGAVAEAMRRILIEDARRKSRQRRGGEWKRVPLESLALASEANPDLLLTINEALEKLAADYPIDAEVVKLLFFAGLTVKEASETLELSESTIKRHWAFARAWLFREISEMDDLKTRKLTHERG
jgi:RNA polymerase sigma factor (TIGR02999 family)